MKLEDPRRIDREVDRVLRADLPGAVSERPAASILSAARAAEGRARRRRRSAAALAACALAGALGLALQVEQARERTARRAQLATERDRIERELAELRSRLEERSRLRLGGDDDTEIVLDLARLEAGQRDGTTKRSAR